MKNPFESQANEQEKHKAQKLLEEELQKVGLRIEPSPALEFDEINYSRFREKADFAKGRVEAILKVFDWPFVYDNFYEQYSDQGEADRERAKWMNNIGQDKRFAPLGKDYVHELVGENIFRLNALFGIGLPLMGLIRSLKRAGAEELADQISERYKLVTRKSSVYKKMSVKEKKEYITSLAKELQAILNEIAAWSKAT